MPRSGGSVATTSSSKRSITASCMASRLGPVAAMVLWAPMRIAICSTTGRGGLWTSTKGPTCLQKNVSVSREASDRSSRTLSMRRAV